MRSGFYLPTRGPTATRAGILALAREGERLGLHSAMVADHELTLMSTVKSLLDARAMICPQLVYNLGEIIYHRLALSSIKSTHKFTDKNSFDGDGLWRTGLERDRQKNSLFQMSDGQALTHVDLGRVRSRRRPSAIISISDRCRLDVQPIS